MKRKLLRAEQAQHEARLEETLRRLRDWRDREGKDRVLLFGYNERFPEEPSYCLLVDRTGAASARTTKHRGRDDLAAARAALLSLESCS